MVDADLSNPRGTREDKRKCLSGMLLKIGCFHPLRTEGEWRLQIVLSINEVSCGRAPWLAVWRQAF
jgi:hypothetical protein